MNSSCLFMSSSATELVEKTFYVTAFPRTGMGTSRFNNSSVSYRSCFFFCSSPDDSSELSFFLLIVLERFASFSVSAVC
jgi:hypothetical protein